MNKTIYLLAIAPFIFLAMLAASCSTVNLTPRKGKDLTLTPTDYLKLKGTYSNQLPDTNLYNFKRGLFENFTLDTTGKGQPGFYTEIIPFEKTLTVNLYRHDKIYIQDELIKSITLKGKFKSGYFKVKRKYPAKFIAGPLLWVLGEHQSYIGLTKENNLVVLDSGGTGVLLLVVVPFFVAGGDKHDYEYARTK
jgi:hypothetical protein